MQGRSELSTLDNDLPRWRKLIAVIRGVYKGDLIYSANWDHYPSVRLFELVDFGKAIESNLSHFNKPLIFSEVGYRSRKDATLAPWDESSWTIPGSNAPRLDGLNIWNYDGFGGPQSVGCTPRGKPALGVIREILSDLKGR